jgi:hypothetical protein
LIMSGLILSTCVLQRHNRARGRGINRTHHRVSTRTNATPAQHRAPLSATATLFARCCPLHATTKRPRPNSGHCHDAASCDAGRTVAHAAAANSNQPPPASHTHDTYVRHSSNKAIAVHAVVLSGLLVLTAAAAKLELLVHAVLLGIQQVVAAAGSESTRAHNDVRSADMSQ